MASLDTDTLVQDAFNALSRIVTDGFDSIAGLVTDHLRRIAAQSRMIAESRISGQLRDDDALFAYFTARLKLRIKRLAQVVAGLTILTIEKAWNAVVDVVWSAINEVLGAAGLGTMGPSGMPAE